MNQDPAIAIQPGERVRFADRFSPNMILTHLKVSVVLTDRRVIVRRPNTLFGIIPKGYNEQSSPLQHVSQVSAGESFSPLMLLYGSALTLFGGLSLLSGLFSAGGVGVALGLISAGIGIFLILKAHTIGISFRNHGGGVLVAGASKIERARVEESKRAINALLFGSVAQSFPSSPTPAAPPVVDTTPVPAPPVPVGSGRFTAEQASDPSTAQSVLSRIAEHEPALRHLVAANPNAYPGLLEWLGTLGDDGVDRALAARV